MEHDPTTIEASLQQLRNGGQFEEDCTQRADEQMRQDRQLLGDFEYSNTQFAASDTTEPVPPPPSPPRCEGDDDDYYYYNDEDDAPAAQRPTKKRVRITKNTKSKPAKPKRPPPPSKKTKRAPSIRPMSATQYEHALDVQSIDAIPSDSVLAKHRHSVVFVRPVAAPSSASQSARVEELDYKPPIHLERALDPQPFAADMSAPLSRFDRYVGGRTPPVEYRAIGAIAARLLEGWTQWRRSPAWRAAMGCMQDPDRHLRGAFHDLLDASRPTSRMSTTGMEDAPAYVKSILEITSPAVDLFTLESGRVHPSATSNLLLRDSLLLSAHNKSFPPSTQGFATTYYHLEAHAGYLRAQTSLAFDADTVSAFLAKCMEANSSALDQTLAAARADDLSHSCHGYVHGSCRDIATALRVPELWQSLTHPMLCGAPCRDANGRPVLITWTDCCRRIMPAPDAASDGECLTRPEWGPFFAALMARAASLPMPSLTDLLVTAGSTDTAEAERVLLRALDPKHISVAATDDASPRRALFLRTFSALFNKYLASLVGEVLCSDFSFLVPPSIRVCGATGGSTAGDAVGQFLSQYVQLRYVGLPHLQELVSASLEYLHNPATWNLVYRPLCIDWNNTFTTVKKRTSGSVSTTTVS